MIEIKQITELNNYFYDYFFKFCVRSKPYDFCEINSLKLRNSKIKEYFEALMESPIIFQSKINSEPSVYVFFSEKNDHLILEFAIGDIKFGGKQLIESLHQINILAQKVLNKSYTSSTIQRKYKKQKFISFLKKYDQACEITQLEDKTQIIWTNERLNQNNRHK